jgi:acetyl esterase/lipase
VRWAGRIALGVSLLGLALALTIPLTMPNRALMIVRIGGAELSLWLLGLTGGAALLAGAALRRAAGRAAWVPRLALMAGLIGAGIAAIPGSQLPDSVDTGAAAMRTALGRNYEFEIPAPVASTMRLTPFSFPDYLTGINPGAPPVARDLPYRTVAGHALLLDRYDPPPSGGPHPGLLIIHGGGWENGDKGEYSEASRYFAARGYVVYDIQYRLTGEARFPAQLEDVECALGYMRAHAAADGLDPERVAVFGRSAGAHLALLAAYRAARDPAQPDCGPPATVKAVIAYYAPTDLAWGYAHPLDPDIIQTRRLLTALLGGSPAQVPDQYAAATPQHWLDRPVPPTLLVHGDADQIVGPANATMLATALQAAGDRVVLLPLPWAGHGFDAIFQGLGSQVALYYWERFMGWALARP